KNFFQLRAPLFEPLPGTLPEAEIYTRLVDAMGLLPSQQVLDEMRELGAVDRAAMMGRAFQLFGENPTYGKVAAILLYRTLGPTLPDGAAAVAPLWAGCHRTAGDQTDAVQRALDTRAGGTELGELLFQRVLSSRSGLVFTAHEYEDIWSLVRHRDRKIHLA